jgi:hypothetical protein
MKRNHGRKRRGIREKGKINKEIRGIWIRKERERNQERKK